MEQQATTRAAELAVYKRIPVSLVSGEGCFVTDTEGRRYLDFYGGHATALLGQAHPALLETVNRQAAALFFQTNLVDLPVRQEAADALCALYPASLNRVFFVNSGAEANENAMRLAFRKTGRSTIVALEGSFHGRTAAAAAVTAGSASWYGFPRTPFDVRWVGTDDVAGMAAAIGPDVAAVILEPVQGVAGAYPIPHEVIRAARAGCDRVGALLISDEVQSGLGRTGHRMAIGAAGVLPDLLTLGKGVAGGFLAAAMLCTEAVASIARTGDLGTTFGGGPIACALIATVARILREERLAERAAALYEEIAATCVVGPVVAVRGSGLLVGLRTSVPAAQVVAGLRDRGILVGTSSDPNVLRLMPSLTLESAHVAQLAKALESL